MSMRVKITLMLLVLAGLSIIAIPKLLSTALVKERVELQLSELTGRKVLLNGGSGISINPYLGVTYDNVTIADERDQPGKPLVVVDRLKAKLGLLGALWGNARLAELELVRPHFNLVTDVSGNSNWAADRGSIAGLFAKAAEEASPSLELGSVRVEDGIFTHIDERSRKTIELTAVNGSASWPNVKDPASGDLSWVWNGEITQLQFQLSAPFLLITGLGSEVEATLSAKPGSVTFAGTANRSQATATGKLSMSSASPRRLFDWLDWSLPAVSRLETTQITGDAVLTSSSIEFSETTLEIGEHSGQGRLQIAASKDAGIEISGTLAFETLSLPSANVLLSTPINGDRKPKAFDYSFLEGLKLDVRLSANSANIGTFEVEDLAASALIRDGVASFDIGDGKALGGSIAGSVELRSADDETSAIAIGALVDVDLSELTNLYQENGFTLSGKGNVSFKLKSSGNTAQQLTSRLNGDGELTSLNGSLTGLDFSEILNSVQNGAESVVRISAGSSAYDQLKIGFFIANGTAFLRDSAIQSGESTVTLSGRSDLVKQSLALRGIISPKSVEGSQLSPLPFFIGGTLSSPLFVPLPIAEQKKAASPIVEKAAPKE